MCKKNEMEINSEEGNKSGHECVGEGQDEGMTRGIMITKTPRKKTML